MYTVRSTNSELRPRPGKPPLRPPKNASSFSDASPGVSHPIHTPLLRVPRRLLTSRSDPVSVVSLSVDHRSGN
ncbi:hypothetical protein CEP52_003281 [Fusarium oligoseptatum]|uniref:Uncharacterized protein n=1 Tax=Fusarium oligoseptatum TaxID=2604345 RepID=A0A428U9Q3_9HYPO|nr:hypothetical protein CEP52_003281 [Fusarium oligoseptatum]